MVTATPRGLRIQRLSITSGSRDPCGFSHVSAFGSRLKPALPSRTSHGQCGTRVDQPGSGGRGNRSSGPHTIFPFTTRAPCFMPIA